MNIQQLLNSLNTDNLLIGFLNRRSQEIIEKLELLNEHIECAKLENGHKREVKFYLEQKNVTLLIDFFTKEEKLSLGITECLRVKNNQYLVTINLETFNKYLQDNKLTDQVKNSDTNTDGISDNNNTRPPVVQETNLNTSVEELTQQVELTISQTATLPLSISFNMAQPSLEGYKTPYETQQSYSIGTHLYGYEAPHETQQSYPTSTHLYGYEAPHETQQNDPTGTHLYGYDAQYETQYGTQQSNLIYTNTMIGNTLFWMIDYEQTALKLGIVDEYRESCLKPGTKDPDQSEQNIKSTSENDNNNNNSKSTQSNNKQQKLKSSKSSDYSRDPNETESESDKESKAKRKQEEYRLFHRKKRCRSTQTLTISGVSNTESSEIKTGNQSPTAGI